MAERGLKQVQGDEGSWLFTAQALQQAREQAKARMAKVLSESRPPAGPPRALTLAEEQQLTSYYLRLLPGLCDRSGATSDVMWTAIVFYKRFFAVTSASEFDPALMLLTCVHTASKVEEQHDLTLSKLLDEAGWSSEPKKSRFAQQVIKLEIHLLKALNFVLLVEPKPDSTCRMLIEELKQLPALKPPQPEIGQSPSKPASEALWEEIREHTLELLLGLVTQSDAVLLWRPSVLIAAVLSAALDERLGPVAGEGDSRASPSDVLAALLDSQLETEEQRAPIRSQVQGLKRQIRELSSYDERNEAIKELKQIASKWQQIFSQIREDRMETHEANRRERKRRRDEVKAASHRQVPTPMLKCNIAELKRRACKIQGQPSTAAAEDPGDEDDEMPDA